MARKHARCQQQLSRLARGRKEPSARRQKSLFVIFPSPIKAAAEAAASDPWQPKTKTEGKTYLRKPAYEYGWDWGPRFVTSGIWKAVRLEAWDKARIADFRHSSARCEQGCGASGRGGGD